MSPPIIDGGPFDVAEIGWSLGTLTLTATYDGTSSGVGCGYKAFDAVGNELQSGIAGYLPRASATKLIIPFGSAGAEQVARVALSAF